MFKKLKQIFSGMAVFAVAAVVLPSGQIVSVPQVAVDKSPALESITFIHYRDGLVKPAFPGKGGGSTVCYGFISKDAKLTAIEDVFVNPDNSGMSDLIVLNQTSNSLTEWDNHTSANIFGSTAFDYSANFDSIADGKNEISFGPYDNASVIAVTRVWGIFSGPTFARRIDQFDILFNTTYSWGDVAETGNANLMDYINIATHEIGHGLGLADLYNTCTNETMYGYSTEGEISKRDLNTGDIQGLQKLYGV
ncbi:MAG: matrixin family metalloprotease [Patescibacteria group bacterium]